MKKKKQSKLYEWQQTALKGGECSRCHRVAPHLTVDHIIPQYMLEQLDDSGLLRYEWEENFELVCETCNKFKNSRLERANPKTIPLLKKLIDQL